MTENCFRPLAGIEVLNVGSMFKSSKASCFRPLAGIEVLNSTPYKWLNYAIENSVCGADFIFRLFSGFLLKFAFKKPQRPLFHHIGAEWYKTYEIYLYYTILLKFFVGY